MKITDLESHDMRYIKNKDDIKEYLECVIQEDDSVDDLEISIRLLLARIAEMKCQSNAQAH